jgi:DNA modification methylase
MTTVTLHEGDNRDHLRRLIAEGVRVHSVVTDPPYGLVSVTKRFGADAAAPAKFGTDGAFSRASAGFMGSKWDGTGIERDPEFWRLIHDILLPGGYVVAFASSRTFHRMAVAIEDAGFITHPMLGWVFGSGFPKAHNAAMAIDKHLGQPGERNPTGDPVKRMIPGAQQHVTGSWIKTDDREYQPGTYVPGTDDGAQWDGWAYGAQALKPALEPIYVGQRPFDGKTGAPSILKHGVGALNIGGCRVPTADDLNGGAYAKVGGRSESQSLHAGSGMNAPGKTVGVEFAQPTGRHPANLLHDGSDGVVALFPAKAGAAAPVKGTEQSHTGDENTHCYGVYGRVASIHHGDTGSAARFFNAFPPEEPYPVFYHSKAGKADRAGSKHPTVKPIALMRWLCRLITPPGGTVLDPFGGSGTTGEAARHEGFHSVLMEAEPQFAADIRQRFALACPPVHYNSDYDDILGGIDQPAELEDLLG